MTARAVASGSGRGVLRLVQRGGVNAARAAAAAWAIIGLGGVVTAGSAARAAAALIGGRNGEALSSSSLRSEVDVLAGGAVSAGAAEVLAADFRLLLNGGLGSERRIEDVFIAALLAKAANASLEVAADLVRGSLDRSLVSGIDDVFIAAGSAKTASVSLEVAADLIRRGRSLSLAAGRGSSVRKAAISTKAALASFLEIVADLSLSHLRQKASKGEGCVVPGKK